MTKTRAVSGLLAVTTIDQYFSRVETIDQLKEVAYEYFPPSDTDYTNAQSPTRQEASAEVMLQCPER